MRSQSLKNDNSTFITFIVLLISIATLYIGRDLFIPLAVAILLSFALSPLVNFFSNKIGNVASTLISSALVLTLLMGLGNLVYVQVIAIATDLSLYEQNIEQRFTSLGQSIPIIEPILRKVRNDPTFINGEYITSVLIPMVLPFLGSTTMILLFTIFMLLYRKDLRDRLIRIVGSGELNRTTEALDLATARLSRFLGMQLLINACYGGAVALGLAIIGVPNYLLWGLLTAVFNYIPYVGSWIAALGPIAFSLIVFSDWNVFFAVLALYSVVDFTVSNVIEPRIFGRSTGLAPMSILLSASFWTWLWGGIGLVLATPLTVCLTVLGLYHPRLKFLHLLLREEPALSPAEQFYQRLLALDAIEAIESCNGVLKNSGIVETYDTVILPTLNQLKIENYYKRLDPEKEQFIHSLLIDLLSHLNGEDEISSSKKIPSIKSQLERSGKKVVCIPVDDSNDMIASKMLCQLLEREGLDASFIPRDTPIEAISDSMNASSPDFICLVLIQPFDPARVRILLKVLTSDKYSYSLMGLSTGPLSDRQASQFSELPLMTSLKTVKDHIRSLNLSAGQEMVKPLTPENEIERLAELEKLGLLNETNDPFLEEMAARASKMLDMPIALVSLVDEKRQFWKAHCGLPPDLSSSRGTDRELSVCGHVVALNKTLVVEDLNLDRRFAGNPFLRQKGLRFYAGAPLRTDTGLPIGTICVLDTKPRAFKERDQMALELVAANIMSQINSRNLKEASPPVLTVVPEIPSKEALH